MFAVHGISACTVQTFRLHSMRKKEFTSIFPRRGTPTIQGVDTVHPGYNDLDYNDNLVIAI